MTNNKLMTLDLRIPYHATFPLGDFSPPFINCMTMLPYFVISCLINEEDIMISFFLFFIVAAAIVGLIFLISKKRGDFFNEGGIDADAIILTVQLTGLCIKNEIQAIIQLQVLPELGKSFVSETRKMLSAADFTRLQPGTRIVVKYNPHNHKDVLIPIESNSSTGKINAEVV